MTKTPSTPWQPANPERLAKQFKRLGWIGFWIQLALLVAPILLLVYVVYGSGPDSTQQKGINLGNYLSYGSLLIMVFTTFWFYRYTRLGSRIADPELRPPQASVVRTLWIGLWAGAAGVVFSMLVLMSAVGRLLFILMANPQTGIMVAPALGGADPVMSVSAIDAVTLASLIKMLAAELILLGFTLWLLFRVTRPEAAIDEATS